MRNFLRFCTALLFLPTAARAELQDFTAEIRTLPENKVAYRVAVNPRLRLVRLDVVPSKPDGSWIYSYYNQEAGKTRCVNLDHAKKSYEVIDAACVVAGGFLFVENGKPPCAECKRTSTPTSPELNGAKIEVWFARTGTPARRELWKIEPETGLVLSNTQFPRTTSGPMLGTYLANVRFTPIGESAFAPPAGYKGPALPSLVAEAKAKAAPESVAETAAPSETSGSAEVPSAAEASSAPVATDNALTATYDEIERRIKQLSGKLRQDFAHSLNEELGSGVKKQISSLVTTALNQNVKTDDAGKAILAALANAVIAPKVNDLIVGNLRNAVEKKIAAEEFQIRIRSTFADFLRNKLAEKSNDPRMQLEQLVLLENKVEGITQDLSKLCRNEMINTVVNQFLAEAAVQTVAALVDGKANQLTWTTVITDSFLQSLETSLGSSALSVALGGESSARRRASRSPASVR